MVTVTTGQEAGVRIFRVDVVQVDQTLARPDDLTEEIRQRAAVSRQVAEAALIVDLSFHPEKRRDSNGRIAILEPRIRLAPCHANRRDVVPLVLGEEVAGDDERVSVP